MWQLFLGAFAVVFGFIFFLYWFTRPLLLPYESIRQHVQNKVIWITGASSGICEALAIDACKLGAKVIMTARRDVELQRLKAHIASIPGATVPEILVADLADTKRAEDVSKSALQIHGKVDIVIHNAGRSMRASVTEASPSVLAELMSLNFFTPALSTRALIPSMVQQKSGHVVVISSMQGKLSMPFRSAYAASKHALHGFFDALRQEVYDDNICVTLAVIGYVNTNLSLNALSHDGSAFGKMDAATSSGFEPGYVSQCLLSGIAEQRPEITIAKSVHAFAVYLTVFPRLLFHIMRRFSMAELRARRKND